MIYRDFGRTGFKVAPIAFGGNVFGWTADEAASFQLLDAFTDAGFNLIDTADVYSVWQEGSKGGESETIIGNWLKKNPGKRDSVVIATKCGMRMSPDLGSESLARDYIRKSIEGSLRRLQIDHIDLYQAHIDDPKTDLSETLGAFTELIKEGKVRAIGASNYSAARLSEALSISERDGLARFESLQPQFNLYDQEDYAGELEELCARHKLAVIPYFALARGFLSGKYRSESDLAQSARGSGIKKYMNPRGFRIIDAVRAIAEKHNSKPSRVALAWLIARPSVTAPIASATKLEQLTDMIEAPNLTLTAEDIEHLNAASAMSTAEV